MDRASGAADTTGSGPGDRFREHSKTARDVPVTRGLADVLAVVVETREVVGRG